MKKRILSLLLVLSMAVGLILPAYAAKQVYKTEASFVQVRGVQVPRAGEHPYTPRGELTPLGGEIFESQLWTDADGKNLTGSDTFAAGKTYHFILVLMPPENKFWPTTGVADSVGNKPYAGEQYVWFDDASFGKADSAKVESGGGLVLAFTRTCSASPVSERNYVEICPKDGEDPVVPVHGAHPNTDGYIVTNGGAYWGCRWTDITDNVTLTKDDTFIGGHTYLLAFYISCDYGVTWKTKADGTPDVTARLLIGGGVDAADPDFSYEWSGTKLAVSWTFVPPASGAAAAVDEVSVGTLTIPSAGAHPQFTGLTADPGTVDRVIWTETGSVKELGADAVFESGKSYTVTINLLPPAGKTWAFKEGKPHLTAVLNFSDGNLLLVSPENGYSVNGVDTIGVSFAFTVPAGPVQAAGSLNILGYEKPSAGKSPVMTGYTLSNGTLSSVEWVDVGTGKRMTASDVFAAGHTYTVSFTVLPPAGKAWQTTDAGAADVVLKIYDKDGIPVDQKGITVSFATEDKGVKPLLVSCVTELGAAAVLDPKIETNPVSQTVKIGDTVSFSVTASGSSLTYQWYEAPEAGAEFGKITDSAGVSGTSTAKLTLSNVTSTRSGSRYVCVVTDVNGKTASSGAAVLTVTLGEASPSISFSDVKESDWFYSSVMEAVGLGLINGKGKDKNGADCYDPDGNITLAEAVKLAACMHELYTKGAVTLKNGDPWYKTYADYAEWTAGILVSWDGPGFSSGSVMANPNLVLTRGAFAWIFARSLPEEALPAVNNVPKDAIPDVKFSDGIGYYEEIYQLYKAGIVKGSDAQGSFKPFSNIKRSEVAAIVVRMMKPETRVDSPFN